MIMRKPRNFLHGQKRYGSNCNKVEEQVQIICPGWVFFVTEKADVDMELWDIHVLAGALKLFFRELKDPLVPFCLLPRFQSAISMNLYVCGNFKGVIFLYHNNDSETSSSQCELSLYFIFEICRFPVLSLMSVQF